MSTLNNRFASLLSTVRTPGDFYATGSSSLPLPMLSVSGVGTVALPLLPAQAEQLITLAERAPFGRGPDTLVDTTVRRTWQIGADKVRIQGQGWERCLADITARAAAGLGVTGAVLPELYKLLIYDEGSFFTRHRDTEKSPGMFATLLINLPSPHAGGDLLVRHLGREVRLGLSGTDSSEAVFAAFYADCSHEVLPVTAGCRLVLVYNLLRKAAGPLPQPPDHRAQTQALTDLLQRWSTGIGEQGGPAGPVRPATDHADPADPADGSPPEKLVYPLEHAYTPAELSFATLKGADAAAAAVLAPATAQAGCDLHVALLRIEESGSAEYSDYSPRRSRWSRHGDGDGDDQFEVGEILDRSLTLSHWGRPDGNPAALGDFPFFDTEISPADALVDLEPDDQSFHEATGNEGASFERSYQMAALVLWPQHRRLAVLNQAGSAVTLPYLADLTRRWQSSGDDQQSALWQEAHTLVGHMLRTWPKMGGLPSATEPSAVGKLLGLLARLADVQHIGDCLAKTVESGQWAQADNAALLRALNCLPPNQAADHLAAWVSAHAELNFPACAALLHRAAQKATAAARLKPAARALLAALPGDPAQKRAAGWDWRAVPIKVDAVATLISALWLIDAASKDAASKALLADAAVAHLLAWPGRYGVDDIIVPALRGLAQEPADRPALRQRPSGQVLWSHCLAHVQTRCAQALAPPASWSRSGTLNCHCQHCQSLARFLTDANARVWSFKANEAERSHLLASAKASHSDVDCVTEKSGRPYSLVCTKNQASYEQRVRQRRQDLEDLAWLV